MKDERELQAEVNFITYTNARNADIEPAVIAAYYGFGASSEMELRYQAERAAKRIANCPDETVGDLSPMERAIADPMQREWKEPLNVTCMSCGVKFCFGKCRDDTTRSSWERNYR